MKLLNLFYILLYCFPFLNYATTFVVDEDRIAENTALFCKVKADITHISCVLNGQSSNDGAIELTVTDYTGPLRFEWTTNNGSGLDPSAKNQFGLSAGNYTLKIYDNGTRVFKKTYAVCKYDNFEVSVEKTDNRCFGASEGTITVNASGGDAPYKFSIDGGATFQNSATFSQLPEGTYNVFVKDNRKCVFEEEVKISHGAYFSIQHPSSLTVEECLTQEEINTLFTDWLSKFNYQGGNGPVNEEFNNNTPPDACGGSVSVNYKATDDCGEVRTCSATFNVPEVEPLAFNVKAQKKATECNDNSDEEFQNWLDNNGYAEVSSGCDEITWSNNFNECVWETICGNTKFIEVTFKASNGCDKIKTKATFTIEDTQAPEFVEALPQDITVSCGEVPDAPLLSGVDSCDDNVQVCFEESVVQNECGKTSIIRNWKAVDCSDNSVSHTQTITIEDTQAPEFVEALPQDIMVSCGKVPDAPLLSGVDSCDDNVQVCFEESVVQNECGKTSIIRNWKAVDCSDNSVSHTQTITIEDNQAPEFVEALPQNITIACSEIPQAETITAIDNCQENIQVVFEEKTNQNECGITSVTRTWTATDCSDNSISHTQTITIEDNQAPEFVEALPQNITIACSEIPQAETITAIDNCQENIQVVFEEKTNQNECGITSVTRTWTATDCSDNSISHTQTITIEDNQAPEFVETLPQDITIACSEIPQAESITAIDNCQENIQVVFEEKTNQNECGIASVIRTWTATDCSDNSISHTQTITIEDNQAPEFVETLPQDITIACSEIPQAETITAIDNCQENIEVVFEEQANQNECGITSVTRTWTATDCSSNSVSHTQTIIIEDNQAPEFVEPLPQNITIACSEIPQAETITAIDNCQENIQVVFEEKTNQNECGITSVIRTWTATDCSDNSVSHTQTITIEDNQAPEFVETLPQDITASCGEVPEAISLTATDGCNSAIPVTFTEERTDDNCKILITRKWTAEDCFGNQASHVQTISIQDMESPSLITDLDEQITIFDGEVPEVPQLLFEDNCDENLGVQFEEISNFISDNIDYEITRAWTVTDDCGNESIFIQTIFVQAMPSPAPPPSIAPLRVCVEDAAINLQTLIPELYSSEGIWEVILGNVNLNNGNFNPTSAEIGKYEILYTPNEPNRFAISLNIEVHDECVVLPCNSIENIVISKTITPNGDAFNEYFTVSGLDECGFRMELEVFNRWGTIVYRSNDYKNNWNGFSNTGIGSSNQIPTGTYFYALTLVDSGFDPIRGYIYAGTSSK
ncbi:HYR-like domain-containing protein [Galbibacter mesophilus]|uniref:HYR-like domain-containing protein n=1 Tax=Galbibacter mesophilus TaxID=379069 RepID=UPI00191CA308|nr:gliding motility-associated C-terminal domain-containing protein [Galbibacter mesophilus]MCM5663036.1 gliding motility-associated C-terminal domain-containing protein [Galbibacter mesophilus]